MITIQYNNEYDCSDINSNSFYATKVQSSVIFRADDVDCKSFMPQHIRHQVGLYSSVDRALDYLFKSYRVQSHVEPTIAH